MSKFSKIAAIMMFGVICSRADAHPESTIRILGVFDSTANITSATSQLFRIKTAWDLSTLGTGIAIDIANFGIPVPLNGSLSGSTLVEVHDDARSSAHNLMALRDQYAADIVIIFTDFLPGNGVCGFGRQYYWQIQNFSGMSPTLGPDLRGAETMFYGLIATGLSGCRAESTLVAHEFGHLLGAGHELTASGSLDYLYLSSHADVKRPRQTRGGIITGYKTVMATTGAVACTDPVTCPVRIEYSGPLTVTGLPDTNIWQNTVALSDTAASISQYRHPAQGCNLSIPTGVSGSVNAQCIEPWTSHNVWWNNSCPQVVDWYEIWAQQPANGLNPLGYSHRWSVFFPTQSDVVFVTGAPANIKIKACESGVGCSPLSISKYRAEVYCDDYS